MKKIFIGFLVFILTIQPVFAREYLDDEYDYEWNESNYTNKNDDFMKVAYGNGVIVTVGEHGTILYSSNGSDWEKSLFTPTSSIVGLNWDGNRFILVTNFNDIYISTNGEDWGIASGNYYEVLKNPYMSYGLGARGNTDSNYYVERIISNGSITLGIPESQSNQPFLISYDQIEWKATENKITEYTEIIDALIIEDQFCIYIRDLNDDCQVFQLKSQDGVSWEKTLVYDEDGEPYDGVSDGQSSRYTKFAKNVVYDGSIFMAVGINKYKISYDGINWARNNGLDSQDINDVVVAKGIIYGVGNKGYIATPSEEALNYVTESSYLAYQVVQWDLSMDDRVYDNVFNIGSDIYIENDGVIKNINDNGNGNPSNVEDLFVKISYNGQYLKQDYKLKLIDEKVSDWYEKLVVINSDMKGADFVLTDNAIYALVNVSARREDSILKSTDGYNFELVYENEGIEKDYYYSETGEIIAKGTKLNETIEEFTGNATTLFFVVERNQYIQETKLYWLEENSQLESYNFGEDSFEGLAFNNENLVISVWRHCYTSYDLDEWKKIDYMDETALKALIWTGEYYLGIDPYHVGNLGTLFRSSDGINWIRVNKLSLYDDIKKLIWTGESLVMCSESKIYYTNPLDIIKVSVNNTPVVFDVAPIVVDNRTLVPLRKIIEAVEGEISWNGETSQITCEYDNTKISFKLGEKIAEVNGEEVELDVASTAIDGRTLVPLRFIMESFGLNVEWYGDTKQISIYN